jgi:hypothetical protein
MKKRVIVFIVVLIVIFTNLLACRNNEKEKNNGAKENNGEQNSIEINSEQQKEEPAKRTMGRFIEKQVNFPEMANGEEVVKIIQNYKKQIEMYTKSVTQYLFYIIK